MTEPKLEAQPTEPATRHWDVAVVGAGYVGVPLARLLAQSGQDRAARRRGRARRRRASTAARATSRTFRPTSSARSSPRAASRRRPTTTPSVTPTRSSSPSPRRSRSSASRTSPSSSSAVNDIAARLRPGHLVVLESTTYPGTTREVVLPMLATSGLEVGRDFHLAFSPERVDPGNTRWRPRACRRSSAGSPTPAPSARPSSTRARSTRCTASRRRRRPS